MTQSDPSRFAGGRGYDPPQWPPKGLELVYGQFELAPQITVVVIATLFYLLVQDLAYELGF